MIKQVFKKPYLYFFILIFLVYLTLNVIISQFYITIQYIPKYLETINWLELILSGIFSLIIGILISISAVLVYIKYKERKKIKKQTFLASLGTIGGFSTGICSACVAGLFPLIFSLFGISFSFLSLPFKGMEIQLLIILILTSNLYFLNKEKKVCS
ncbi:hypothetical protein HYV88_01030 [Candidatus Woesearchaeota archaeon]|nr:hypothetical protein [Candidatus Woesearchaeota archaeon]